MAPAPASPASTIRIVTARRGRQLAGVTVRVGEDLHKTPVTIPVAPGEEITALARDSRYAGRATCVGGIAPTDCVVNLERSAPSKEPTARPPRPTPASGDDDDLFDLVEDR